MVDRVWDKSRPPTGEFVLNRDCPQAQGLVAWWPHGMAAAPNTAFDAAGRDHLTGTATRFGVRPEGAPSVVFASASSQYIRSAASPVTAFPLSISGWAKPYQANANGIIAGLSGNGTNIAYGRKLLFVTSGGTLNLYTQEDSATGSNLSGGSYTANQWVHGVAVFSSGSLRIIYNNGAFGGTSLTAVNFGTPGGAYLGADQNPGNYFNGELGEAGMWARALTAEDAFRLYDPATRYELWYPLRSKKWFSPGAGPSTITPAAGAATTSTLAGSASASAAITPAAGAATAATLAGASTAAAAITPAAGAATATTLAGSAGASAAITPAAGVATPSTAAGSATAEAAITPASGVGTGETLAGSDASSGESSVVPAAGVATAATLAGSATAEAGITPAAGVATAATLTGAADASATITPAAGAATAGTLTGSGGTAGASDLIPAAGAATTETLAGSATAVASLTPAAGVATTGVLGDPTLIVVPEGYTLNARRRRYELRAPRNRFGGSG